LGLVNLLSSLAAAKKLLEDIDDHLQENGIVYLASRDYTSLAKVNNKNKIIKSKEFTVPFACVFGSRPTSFQL
jgi:hypothetical protein